MDDDDRVVVVEEEEEEELIFEAEDEGMEEDEEEKRTVKAVVVEENVVEVNNEDLEEGEVSEPEPEVSKNTGRTLRVHLPDLLQGIDGNDDIPMNLDTIEKLDRRAKRFNTTNPMPADEVCKVYDSLGIPVEERERRNTGNFRLEYILMYGVFSLSDEDILEYFEEFSPMEVLDLGEDSCIVKFRNCLTSLKAMMELSKPIGEPKKEERIVKHVLTADDEPERRVVTRDIKNKLDGLVHPDDIPLEEMPEGKWRLGNYHKKV
ncbi:nuclear cap-binding protein subunit 3 [Eurytemora carolleeae]|uniref:nuclear cap-binding protein subunit 3 n=1 Tax=Eurytemora carolleeae TaxID=1294199 RepID=UPI000C792E1C|nr:nuclear cap-binding protein subunit 3 [Eurytemora carolleeae]|eukprot:XP_023338970.1 nuclear cap-binding protein subunit 3-like [Eurytemora affinis]